MKEFKNVLVMVADALKSFAEGVTTIAEEIEAFSKSHADTEPQSPPPDEKPAGKKPKAAKKKSSKKPATREAAVKKSTKKTNANASTEKKAPLTASDTVFQLINDATKGIDTGTLMKKTGFDKKKVSNIIQKLKQQGKIETPERGIYTKK